MKTPFITEKKYFSKPYWIWGVVVFAIALRVFFGLAFYQWNENTLLDAERYSRVAVSLIEGRGFCEWGNHSTAFVPPIYPLFLAGCFRIFGVHFLPVIIIQAILGGILPWLVYRLGIRLGGIPVGILSAIISAIYPELVVISSFAYTETFFIIMTVLFLLQFHTAMHSAKIKDWALVGLIFGLGLLIRSLLFFFPLFLFLVFLFVKDFRRFLKGLLVMSLVGYSTLIPWTIRNYKVFHAFVPVSTGGAGEFWIGTYIPFEGRYRHQETSALILKLTQHAKNEVEKDKILFRTGLKNIQKNPARYLWISVKKAFRFVFQIYENIPTGRSRTPNFGILLVLGISYYSLLFTGMIGIWVTRKNWKEWILFYALSGYALLIYSATHFVPRYRIPLIPLFGILSACGILGVIRFVMNSKLFHAHGNV